MLLRGPILALMGMALLINQSVQAQDTLPSFSAYRLAADRVQIEWKNPDTSLRQLSIQQSVDSLYGFKTILTVLNPRLPQNGTVLRVPTTGKIFYRIYLLYPRGKYLFTASKSPVAPPPPPPTPPPASRKNKDSIGTRTDSTRKDTVSQQPLSTIQPGQETTEKKKKTEPAPEPIRYVPSAYLFTQPDGYPFIKFPAEWDLTQVQIRFFQENGELLFALNQPPFRIFRIDKTNFHRAGWYPFEIWHKGVRIESNRFYLPLEF